MQLLSLLKWDFAAFKSMTWHIVVKYMIPVKFDDLTGRDVDYQQEQRAVAIKQGCDVETHPFPVVPAHLVV